MIKLLITEIDDCLKCPKLFKCTASKQLSAEARFFIISFSTKELPITR